MHVDVVEVSELEPVPRERASADVNVMTRAEIEALGARTLVDVLRAVPGIDVSLDNDGTVRPAIRGLDEAADILLVIDGVRVNDALDGAGYYEWPAALIERVEILRGPGSAIYGGNAILAVISVTTREVEHALFGLRAGSFTTAEGYLLTATRQGRWRVNLGVDYARSNGPDFRLARDVLSSSQPDIAEAPGKINGSYDRVMASFRIARGSVELAGVVTQDDRGPYVGPLASLAREGHSRRSFAAASATIERPLSQRVRLFARASASRWRLDQRGMVQPPGWRSTGVPTDLDGDGLREVFADGLLEVEQRSTYQLAAEARLGVRRRIGTFTGGIAGAFTQIADTSFETNTVGSPALLRIDLADYSGRTFPEVRRLVVAPFVQWEHQLTHWLAATVGARFDISKDRGGPVPVDARASLSPRAALLMTPGRATTVRLGYGRAFREPTLRELHNPAGRALGNPALDSQTGQTAQLSVSRRFGPDFELRAAGFVTRIDQRIDVPLTTSIEGQNRFINHQGTRVLGGELEIYGRLCGDQVLFANVSLQDATDVDEDAGLGRVARWSANLGGELRPSRWLMVGGVAHLRGPRRPPALTFFQRERLDNTQQPATLVIDAHLRTRELPDGWWVGAAAYNLYGTDYREVPRDAFFLLDQPGGSNTLPVQPRMFLVEVGRSM